MKYRPPRRQVAQAARYIHQSVQETVIPQLHRWLGIASRIIPLPEELPPLPKDPTGNNMLVAYTERFLQNSAWWKNAPDGFPVSEEEIDSLLKAFDTASSDTAARGRLETHIRTHGISQRNLRVQLQTIIECYHKGGIPKPRKW